MRACALSGYKQTFEIDVGDASERAHYYWLGRQPTLVCTHCSVVLSIDARYPFQPNADHLLSHHQTRQINGII